MAVMHDLGIPAFQFRQLSAWRHPTFEIIKGRGGT